MGSILQDVERLPPRDWEPEKRASISSSRPIAVGSNTMGRRPSQRNSLQPQLFPRQEGCPEKEPPRRKHKSNTHSSKSTPPPYSSQGASASCPTPSLGGRKEAAAPRPAPRWDRQRRGGRRDKHTAPSSNHRRPSSSTELLEVLQDSVEDSDTDMSESEKGLLASSCSPPQLDLRPEVIEDEDHSSHSHSIRGAAHGVFHYPDFLPPPFNLWSLSQLAVFYNTEGRAAPRPVGSLERYLERLLQLEWHQIQTVQEELESLQVSEVTPGCHRSAAATGSCLSSPKSILQCQRAFPLTFLSSLASHSAFGCACTLCWIRCSTCSSSCCRSMHTSGRPSRLNPMPDRSRGHTSLPKRSYSESRVHSSDRTRPFQGLSSPSRTSSHLRRMQALGNIRNPVPSAPGRPHSTCRDSRVHAAKVDVSTVGQFRRSGSEQRRGGVQRHQNRQDGSEFRKGRSDECRAAHAKNHKTKPKSVSAVRDHVPRSTCPPNSGQGRAKAVEFVA
uniref:Family with sequence similarity 217, member B n=2 Tax=Nothobranchius kadleci TaxID=1051664 RepID=A0A1A8CPQ4_NOTKA